MKRFKSNRKLVSLTLVGIAYVLIVTPLIINNLQKQQDLRGRAQTTQDVQASELKSSFPNQSAQSLCTAAGTAEIGISYTNTDKNRSTTVTAIDSSSGQAIPFGEIKPEETITKTISSGKSSFTGGTIQFNVTYADNPSQQQQLSALYGAKSCQKATSANLIKAQADAPATCGSVTTDVVLSMDRSGSMGQNNKMAQAKNAAKNFIDVVPNEEPTNRVGLVSYASDGRIDRSLTTNYASVKAKVDALSANGNTCIECGIKNAHDDIKSKGRPNVKKAVILLTDGIANYVVGTNTQVETKIAEERALAAAADAYNDGIVFFVIGFGADVNKPFLQKLATDNGGKFYFPAPDELDGVYQEIATLVGKGILGGYVYNDVNLNGTYDTNEAKLPGWTIQAKSSAANRTAVTDNDGRYIMTGLCDGDYTLSQQMKTGWTQTEPKDPTGYAVTITNASQQLNKNFGNTDKTRCSDALDNDNNGYKDAADSSCHTDGNPNNPNSYDPKKDGEHGSDGTCGDSKDNNNNGTIDGGDPVCHTDGNPSNPNTYDPKRPEVSPRCSDNLDNDNNGYKDTADSSCHTDGNPKNPNSYDPKKDGEYGSDGTCGDSKDNNGDGTIDGGDPICHTDNNSNNPNSYDPKRPEILTTMDVTVFLHGIGNSGDNTNPNGSSLSNKDPKHPQVGADIQVFTLQNNLIASGTGTVVYQKETGNYRGEIPIQNGFPTGQYTIKVKADTYLRKLVNGVQNITAGKKNTVSTIALTAGDVNNDNKLNILDYNLLLDCYSDLGPATNCSLTTKKDNSDLNDDGAVNQTDYNLFLREISVQLGQ